MKDVIRYVVAMLRLSQMASNPEVGTGVDRIRHVIIYTCFK